MNCARTRVIEHHNSSSDKYLTMTSDKFSNDPQIRFPYHSRRVSARL